MATNLNEQKQAAASGAVFEPFITKPEVALRLNKRVRTVDNWMQEGPLLLQEREVGGVQVERSGTAVEPTLPREQGGRS